MNQQFLCKEDELAPGQKKRFKLNDGFVMLANIEGTFFAIEDKCSHAGAVLSSGNLSGDEIECPWHGAKFNIKTGEATVLPAVKAVKTYKIFKLNNSIYLIDPMNQDNCKKGGKCCGEDETMSGKDGCKKHHDLDGCEEASNGCCCDKNDECAQEVETYEASMQECDGCCCGEEENSEGCCSEEGCDYENAVDCECEDDTCCGCDGAENEGCCRVECSDADCDDKECAEEKCCGDKCCEGNLVEKK